MSDSMPPNFDSVARLYRWVEYLSFGTLLERCRFHYLDQCMESRQGLILGDGDGRFTARLFASNPVLRADAVDLSPAMLMQLEQRVARAITKLARTRRPEEIRLRTICADVRNFIPTAEGYDLVVSHFLLDCLTDRDVQNLVEHIVPRLAPRSFWLVSEFAVPEKGWRRMAARLLIRWLYFAFRKLTHLQVRHIPDYAATLTSYGFRRRRCAYFLGGILAAELWERKPY